MRQSFSHSHTLNSQNSTTHKSSGSKWGTNSTPPPPRKWPRLLIRSSDQCGLLYFSTVMGNFLPHPMGITSQLKKRSVCILFGVSVCKHLNSLFKFSCCSYCSYKKVLCLSAPTWIHAHMQKWKKHTQAGSDWSRKFLNIYRIPSKQCYF